MLKQLRCGQRGSHVLLGIVRVLSLVDLNYTQQEVHELVRLEVNAALAAYRLRLCSRRHNLLDQIRVTVPVVLVLLVQLFQLDLCLHLATLPLSVLETSADLPLGMTLVLLVHVLYSHEVLLLCVVSVSFPKHRVLRLVQPPCRLDQIRLPEVHRSLNLYDRAPVYDLLREFIQRLHLEDEANVVIQTYLVAGRQLNCMVVVQCG